MTTLTTPNSNNGHAAAPTSAAAGPGVFPVLNLQKWIRQNKDNLKPPVSNKQLFTDSGDVILFVSGGPNTRNDFHVNPTEELFYQLKGDIAVRVRPLDGSPPRDIVVKEGDLFLLPRWVPHRPQRPAGTIGLIVEFPRPEGENDGLQWYCPECDHLVHDARWRLKKIDEDLKIIMEDFWGGPEDRRTCKNCGHVIQRAVAVELKAGKIKAAGSAGAKRNGKANRNGKAKPAKAKPAAKKAAPKSSAKRSSKPAAKAKRR